MAVFRPAPRRRCPALTSGPNYTKLGFLGFCRPFHLNRALETERHHYWQIDTVLAVFWRFFGWLQDDAALRLPLDRIALNSVSWAFAGHFTGIGWWKRKNTSISRLPQFCSLEQLLAFFRPAPRRRCPALTSGLNYTKLGFLGFCRPLNRNQALKTGKYQYKQITPILLPGATFGGFSAGSKTTLSCAYPWPKLHPTRLLGLLQAIPPESSVENGKIPVLADYPNFAPWSNFWRFFGRLQDDAVLR